jgi:predicted lipoprotein with Yx(FWY)xxD motif
VPRIKVRTENGSGIDTRFLTAAAAVWLTTMVLVACGSSNNDAAQPTTPNGAPAALGVADNADLGKILVDAKGHTLYLFAKDTGTASTCTGPCASQWPPLRASGKPTTGAGATASLVSTTRRDDGPAQVTYNGHPLYTYAGDANAGDTNGQGLTAFGGGWFAVSSRGSQVAGTGSNGGATGY